MVPNRFTQKLLSLIFVIALAVFTLSFSISIPIFCRFIYYAHIEPLDLPQTSGFTTEQIRTSYDAMMDYLTLPNKEFSLGEMSYTYTAAEHFKEVKGLFTLNTVALICSVVYVVVVIVLKKFGKVAPLKLGEHTPSFYSGIMVLVIPILVGLFALIDFKNTFLLFHEIVFQNNDYWLFDPSTDQIITVLPPEFFMNCAIIISAVAISLSLTFIIADLVKKRKNQVDFNKEV